MFINTGVYPDQAYSVLGIERLNGDRLVHLRNPWGNRQPAKNGEISVRMQEFTSLFCSLTWVEP
jgi:hypothetical protein